MTHVKKNKKFQSAYKENRMSSPLLDRRRDTSRCSLTSPVMRAAKRCSSAASSFLSSIITYPP